MKDTNKLNPEIRFSGFTDDWEQRKLSDIYRDIGNAFVGTATPYYVEEGHFYLESNNVKDGQINHNTEVFINDEFYEKQKDKWLHTGDMVMVQSGHVGHAAVIPEELDCSAAHALIMFRNPKVKIEPYFLNYQYQTVKAKKKIENITTGNTIKHILASEMQKFIVDVASYDEQEKIAGFFSHLDSLITLHQRKLDKLKTLKKAMLEKMFPKNGESVPEIRFSGFTDDWELRKVSDLLEERNEQAPETEDYPLMAFIANEGVAPKGERYDRGALVKDAKNKNYKKTELGDFIYSSNNLETGSIGLNNYGNASISPVYSIFKPTGMADSDFIGRRFVRKDFINAMVKWRQGVVYGQWKIHESDFLKIEVAVPSFGEQRKIGSYLNILDNLITLHQRKLDKLKTLKKAMLEKMFI
ncbi:restriction endonuclease subunit S [Streptococcus infantarius]|uniref:restriction endonuclease subunit S n=1 Tax=Streptococcus infantarius TaxID=102684 RepID=UPI00208EFD46|nr:restriction endonuclease subunit S [Streptococcus infantarius]MCO4501374.1 hypothetical protein [Streptococcus infantarius subsp. infantarius]MCY7241775.1 restriction endonuclease subunit S [Streptococcus infantarius]